MANPFIGAVGGALGMLTARHAAGSLTIGGLDIMQGLASEAVLSFAYADNTSDQADDLQIVIADPHRTWMQTYVPKKGVECTAQIKVYNWNILGDTRMIDCGTFWLDQIDFAGPPNTVSIKAVSIPVITGMKNQKKTRSWEGQDLMSIAQQIATENGLTLVWDTPQLPKLDRVDQTETPDSEFIRDRAKDASLSVKIYKKQLVIYSEEEYEAKPPVYVLTYGLSNILNYAFSSKLDDTYKESKVSYVSPKSGELLEDGFTAPVAPEGTESTDDSTERIQDDDSEAAGDGNGGDGGGGSKASPEEGFSGPIATGGISTEDGKRKAKAKLRDKNKKEKECQMSVVGNPDYLSGLNVQLLGFGIFDGKWFISSSAHSISGSGYVTELGMRAALEGY